MLEVFQVVVVLLLEILISFQENPIFQSFMKFFFKGLGAYFSYK